MGSFSAPIEIRGLTKTFKAARAVNDLSFDVQAGSITGFLGPNGSGKTTTLRMLLGLVSPTSGSATINGTPMRLLPNPARTVGAVLDVGSLHPKRTALGHLEIYAAAIGMPTQRAAQVLDMVGLRSVGVHKTGTFSLGMRQRLILATAMLGDPEILVLDEPANGLDPEGMAWLRQFLQTFAGSGRTVLISSHALREVEATVDSVVIVSAGSLVYQGTMDELRRSQRSRLLVSCSNPALLATALAARGIIDAQITQDGRLAVGGTDTSVLPPVASAAGVTIFGVATEGADLEQLTRFPRSDTTAHPVPVPDRAITALPHTDLPEDTDDHALLTLRYWWALAIAPVVVAVLIAASTRTFVEAVADSADTTFDVDVVSTGVSLGVSNTLVLVFAAVFGALTAGSEFGYKTLTTTFLTARGRDGVLGAKLAVVAVFAVGYALAVEVVSIGAMLLFGRDF
eukprot:gene23760-28489_t